MSQKKLEIHKQSFRLALAAIEIEMMHARKRFASEKPNGLHYMARVHAYRGLAKALEEYNSLMPPVDQWSKD